MKISLHFLAIALICLLLADIEISTLDPWQELLRMLTGALSPDIAVLADYKSALLNTLIFAICGTFLGVGIGGLLAAFFHFHAVRLFCAFIRSIHEIFWAFLFLPVVGLYPVCGVLAIAIPYAGIFAKVYAEILQESDKKSLSGLPAGASPISKFFYGIMPLIYNDVKNYTFYRFECALRSSAILGFIGLPTIGFHLETAFREGLYAEAAALLYAFYLLIASIKYWLKPRLALGYVVLSFIFLSKEIAFSWQNFTRFLTWEILPWPMRREGVLDGTQSVAFPVEHIWSWAKEILSNEALPGLWNTVILTQIVLAGTAIFALLAFPLVSRYFSGRVMRRASHYFLIVMRTTPEYILAYIFIQLWGPSMLPAIFAISLHNGAILAWLSGQNTDLIDLRPDAPAKKINRYIFEILPRVYGQFLAFLFYRWEVIMRESAILGILGVYTLGFFIDSAIAEDKLDVVVLLIFVTAVLNMAIDTISQRIRKKLKLSTRMMTRF